MPHTQSLRHLSTDLTPTPPPPTFTLKSNPWLCLFLPAVAALHKGAPGQMTWLEDPPPWLKPWLRPAYCFASVIIWTENKYVTISDRFICFISTVKWRWRPMFWGWQLKKVVNFFEENSASGWFGWRIFWPRNDLSPLLRWRRHWLPAWVFDNACRCSARITRWRRWSSNWNSNWTRRSSHARTCSDRFPRWDCVSS